MRTTFNQRYALCEALALFLLQAGFTIRGCHQPGRVVAPYLENKEHQLTFHLFSLLRSEPLILRRLLRGYDADIYQR